MDLMKMRGKNALLSETGLACISYERRGPAQPSALFGTIRNLFLRFGDKAF